MLFERMVPLHSTNMIKKLMWGRGFDSGVDDEDDKPNSGWVGLGWEL